MEQPTREDALIKLMEIDCAVIARREGKNDNNPWQREEKRQSEEPELDYKHLANIDDLNRILSQVTSQYRIGFKLIRSKVRSEKVWHARHVFYYLSRQLTVCSAEVIGKFLGGRDHSTVLHGCDRMKALLEDPSQGHLRSIIKILEFCDYDSEPFYWGC